MLHGPLHEIGLIEVLQLLERGGRAGGLQVVGPDPTVPRTIFLRGGRIAAVWPDADDHAVARGLVRRHLATGGGEALDGPETVPLAVRVALREHLARQTLGAMLQWTQGRFDFTEQTEVAGDLDWSTDALVLDLVRREGVRLDLAEVLEGFRAVPVVMVSDAPAGSLAPFRPDPTDWRLLDAADGVRDVAAIAAVLDEPLEEVGHRVRQLVAAAIFELRAAPPDVTLAARAAIEGGRHDDAAAGLRERLATVPGDAEAWRLLGLAEVGAGRFERAIEAWEGWAAADASRTTEAAALVRAALTMLEALRETRD